MSARDHLTPEQRAALAELLGDVKPARTDLLHGLGEAVRDCREHDHPRTAEDLYCGNLGGWLGERMGPVLRRMLDAEADAARYRTAWRMARTRARSLAVAADRSGALVRELQPALQDAVAAILGMQMERDKARTNALRKAADAINALPQDFECDPGRGDAAELLRRMADEARKPASTEAAPAEAEDVDACDRCRTPFDPTDARFDGRARHSYSPFCRRCVDRCHESSDAFHVCAVCRPSAEGGEG